MKLIQFKSWLLGLALLSVLGVACGDSDPAPAPADAATDASHHGDAGDDGGNG